MIPLATVLIPTFNHGDTIKFALDSALNQTVPVEIFIIGDGVPDAMRSTIKKLVAEHDCVRFFDNPKHERRGEPYRHEALKYAQGKIICYLCDRDLWLPDHVERMNTLLQDADFVHSLSMHVLPGGGYRFYPVDLSLPQYRLEMLKVRNRVAFSCAAHTLSMYQALDEGWTTTPRGKATDWHMFQKFLGNSQCKTMSAYYPSAITFPSPGRLEWTEEQRIVELSKWQEKLSTDIGRMKVVQDVLEQSVQQRDVILAKRLRYIFLKYKYFSFACGLAVRLWRTIRSL